MAELDNTPIIGDFSVRMTGWDDLTEEDTQYDKLRRYDKALGHAHHHSLHLAPASFYPMDLYIVTDVPDGGTGNSCRITAPWPYTVWAADVGCESAAGATGTVDLYTDDGSTDDSILDAAEDVKGHAGQCVRVAPEDGKEEVEYGTEVYIKGASGAGGVMKGAQAHLWCQRR